MCGCGLEALPLVTPLCSSRSLPLMMAANPKRHPETQGTEVLPPAPSCTLDESQLCSGSPGLHTPHPDPRPEQGSREPHCFQADLVGLSPPPCEGGGPPDTTHTEDRNHTHPIPYQKAQKAVSEQLHSRLPMRERRGFPNTTRKKGGKDP